MERYWDCSLCRIEDKGAAFRCRACRGKLRGRERLLQEICQQSRVRRRASWLSGVAAGLGQIYTRRPATGIGFGLLIPLAVGLVWFTWDGFTYGHGFIAASAGFVLIVAALDAYLGPRRLRPPCQQTCPAGLDIPDYLQLLVDADYAQGYALVRTRIPLVGVIGRVCPHPCEGRCLRGIDGEPIAINGCKRFLADRERRGSRESAPESGGGVVLLGGGEKSVGVVGAGPAGLACAYYLSVLGVAVTVYDAHRVPGGRLATTLPDYRLPPYILEEEIEDLRSRGVVFVTDTPVGPGGRPLQTLLGEHAAVFLAVGAGLSVPLEVPGSEACVDFQAFLHEAKEGGHPRLGRRVAVVGGGNAAIDVCRTALRSGAEEVHLLYRRTRDEMPARADEVAEARHEGVTFHFLTQPLEAVVSAEGVLTGLKLQGMRLGDPDESGRPRPVAVAGEERFLEVDACVPALGQQVGGELFDDPLLAGLGRRPDGEVIVDPRTQRTNLARVYAGGDAVSGPSMAVEAMAQGRRAALAMYADLGLGALPQMRLADRRLRRRFPGHRETPEARIREEMPTLSLHARAGTAREVEEGFRESAAAREAGRCLQCHREL